MKRCSRCKLDKPLGEFPVNNSKKDGLSYYCRKCKTASGRNSQLKRNFGITLDDFQSMLAAAGGMCSICSGSMLVVGRGPNVDHCHKTNKVRGLLCNTCNTAIGLLKDNIKILQGAIRYLKKHNKS